jgi:bacillopeptidase F
MGTAIFLIVAFIFVIMPGFLRFVANVGGATENQDMDDFPPQVPFIAAPPSATSSATIKVSGYGEPESEVVFVLNGSEHTREKIETEGTFEADISLVDGENTLTAYAIDASGNESLTGRSYSVAFDDEVPTIEISEPQPDQSFELRANQTLTIKGKTEANARVMVNGRLAFADAEGNFSATYQMQEGDNLIKIEAEDAAGNKGSTELTVKFRL